MSQEQKLSVGFTRRPFCDMTKLACWLAAGVFAGWLAGWWWGLAGDLLFSGAHLWLAKTFCEATTLT